MQIIIKPTINKKLETLLDEVSKDSAIALLFGIKGFSISPNAISLNELKKLKEKYLNTSIYVLLDKNFFNHELDGLRDILKALNNLDIAGVLFYDLAIINICGKENLNLNLVWNQNFLVTNYQTCNYYYNKGIKNAVLSSEITIDEIMEIADNTKMQLFVNVFGYQLMSFSKRSLISNYFKHIKSENNVVDNYLLKEGKKYLIKELDCGTAIYTSHILNGLLKINELKSKDMNIILDEMNIDSEVFLEVLNIYKNAINNNLSFDEVKKSNIKIENMLINTSLGFFDTKTIYKMKKNTNEIN